MYTPPYTVYLQLENQNNEFKLAKTCVELDWVVIFSGLALRATLSLHTESFDLISKM